MPLAEATALASAHFEQHDPAADRAALGQLAELCEQFSPIVGIQPPNMLDHPDTLSLEVTGLGPLFGGEQALVQQVVRAFHQWGFVVQVALADTLGAAWAIAHFGKYPPENSSAVPPSSLAPRPSPLAPKFPIVVPPGQTIAALADLPVAALRLESEVAILAELGIQRIGQLLELPREALAARFDPQLLLRLDQATGAVSEIIVPHRPPPDITAEMELEYPIEDRQTVDMILGQLIERVGRALAERQQGAIQLECRLEHEAGEATKAVVGLFRASAHAKHLLELAQMQLDRIALAGSLKKGTGTSPQREERGIVGRSLGASPLFQPVVAMKLSVLAAAPLQAWQSELFEPSHRESRRHVAQLVDRLSNRLGREAVVRAVPQPDAQPEFAFRYEPLAGVLPRKAERGKSQRWKLLPRPLRLENEPIPLEVLSVVPDGPPIQFHLRLNSTERGARSRETSRKMSQTPSAMHDCHRVARVWGPERIQTGWWRGHYVGRDYYRIETTTGIRLWLFRRLSDAKWFLHGVFD